MPVKLRLARHGRKKFAFFHIVAADGRAPRDGRFIEKLGIYNPNTDPATIELDFEKSLNWLEKGAQPTETVRAILSYKGVLMKKHLMTGVRKGALSEEEAERKFAAWLKEKEAKIQSKKDGLSRAREEDLKKRMEVESKINEERAAEIRKKKSELTEVEDKEDAADAPATETPAEEPVSAQAAVTPETAGESKEAEKEPPQGAAAKEDEASAGKETVEDTTGKKAEAGKAEPTKAEDGKGEEPAEEKGSDSAEEGEEKPA